MFQHHGIASIHMLSHTLVKFQHEHLLVSLEQGLLPELFDGDVEVSSHGHINEQHVHYHHQSLELLHGVAFVKSVPYKRCHHQTTFQHHVERLELIQVVCLHVQRYAYHGHHHQQQL